MANCGYFKCTNEVIASCSCPEKFMICKDHINIHMEECGNEIQVLHQGNKVKIINLCGKLNHQKINLIKIGSDIQKIIERNVLFSCKAIDENAQSLYNSFEKRRSIQKECLNEAEKILKKLSSLDEFSSKILNEISMLLKSQMIVDDKYKLDQLNVQLEELKIKLIEKDQDILALCTEKSKQKKIIESIEDYKEKYISIEKEFILIKEQLLGTDKKLMNSNRLLEKFSIDLEKCNKNLLKCESDLQESQKSLKISVNKCKNYELNIKTIQEEKRKMIEELSNIKTQIKNSEQKAEASLKASELSNLDSLQKDQELVQAKGIIQKTDRELSEAKLDIANKNKKIKQIKSYLEASKKDLAKKNEKINIQNSEIDALKNSKNKIQSELADKKIELKTSKKTTLHMRIIFLEFLDLNNIDANTKASVLISIGLNAESEWNYHHIKLANNKKFIFVCM